MTFQRPYRAAAFAGGVVTSFLLFGGLLAVGRTGTFEALRLLEATLPTIRFLSSTVVGASMTVLALMLTLLGMSLSTDWRFKEIHYERIWDVTVLAILSVVLGIAVLVTITVPLEEVDELRRYYSTVYYAVSVASAVLGGLVVAMTIMIGISIKGLVSIGTHGKESEIVHTEVEDEE